MELFDIEAGKVVLDPNILYIPEFISKRLVYGNFFQKGNSV